MGSSRNNKWGGVPREPEERLLIVQDLMCPLKHLSGSDLFKYRFKFENIILGKEYLGYDLKVKAPQPPASLFGPHPRENIELNIAEWVLYLYDLNTLIDEKRAEGRQLKLNFPAVRKLKKD
jgi:hypothetical protein